VRAGLDRRIHGLVHRLSIHHLSQPFLDGVAARPPNALEPRPGLPVTTA
jgi:hypothetical protein